MYGAWRRVSSMIVQHALYVSSVCVSDQHQNKYKPMTLEATGVSKTMVPRRMQKFLYAWDLARGAVPTSIFILVLPKAVLIHVFNI
jgi:hypothetical protein